MSVCREEHLNPHAGSELRDISLDPALPENVSELDRDAVRLAQVALQ
jgi:hypothetical protein